MYSINCVRISDLGLALTGNLTINFDRDATIKENLKVKYFFQLYTFIYIILYIRTHTRIHT